MVNVTASANGGVGIATITAYGGGWGASVTGAVVLGNAGGGIVGAATTTAITDSVIANNLGMGVSGASVTVTGCLVANNSAGVAGSSLTVSNSVIVGNGLGLQVSGGAGKVSTLTASWLCGPLKLAVLHVSSAWAKSP